VKLTVACVGRAGRGPERALYEHYAQRIRWPLVLREVEEKRPLPAAQRIRREGELLLQAVPAGSVVVALDRRGRTLGSEAFAEQLARWRDQSVADLAFLIGGADGHDEALLRQSSLALSFGAMTWPHLLARAMLAEQLYRAQQLIAGHPYHRGPSHRGPCHRGPCHRGS
jgi:23S rRNA (pseudouridine1915-N3)-methyltransferase